MNNERQVNWRIILDLLKGKRPFAIMGVAFTCISLFILIPMMFIFSSEFKKPYEKYDFEGIKKRGIEKSARITAFTSLANVTVNGEHPLIISYAYESNGHTLSDQFETFDRDKIENYKEGQTIRILEYQNQTMIKGLEPYAFPFYIFNLFPVIFLLIGLTFLLITLIPALRTFKLYKSGIVKEAHIISVTSNSSLSPFRGLRQFLSVNYYFFNELGNKIFGESTTGDMLFLNDKKTGDVIKIFVSPIDETRSCLVPTLEAMKYNWNI